MKLLILDLFLEKSTFYVDSMCTTIVYDITTCPGVKKKPVAWVE